ncbi:hypothetical protein A2U01_0108138, partial [Trifolium medium]|nr:hypothetical protein [Trifolium medium]
VFFFFTTFPSGFSTSGSITDAEATGSLPLLI